MNPRLKSYVIYLVIVMPFVVLDDLFAQSHLLRAAVCGVIVFAGMKVKDPIQRKVWR